MIKTEMLGKFLKKYILPFLLACIFLAIGTAMNSGVVYFNGGRMPIIEDDRTYEVNDSTHFTITNKTEIKLYYFGDILKARLNKRNRMAFFSIGDIFLWTGLGITVITGLILCLRIIWEK